MAEPTNDPDQPAKPPPATTTRPERQPYYGDEVSLRELYLTFRSGLSLIVLVMLLFGIVAFVVTSLRPDGFQSTASVNVIPPFVGTDSLSGLELSVTAGIDQESYQEIAYSPDLLSEVGEAYGYNAAEMSSKVTVTTRPAPSQTRGHLFVDHTVTIAAQEGADQTDDLANAWAEATVSAVAEALSSHLAGAVETVGAEIDERRAAYQTATNAWADFLARDERLLIQQRLTQLAQDPTAPTEQDAELRQRLAALEREAATLEREVSTTSLVYFRVAPMGPALELQRNLVAGSVFVAIPASTPVKVETAGRLVVSIAAAAVGGLLATMLVFFRAAVRER